VFIRIKRNLSKLKNLEFVLGTSERRRIGILRRQIAAISNRTPRKKLSNIALG
jgi:hypothetical protein